VITRERTDAAAEVCAEAWERVRACRLAMFDALEAYRLTAAEDALRARAQVLPILQARVKDYNEARRLWEELQSFLLMCIAQETGDGVERPERLTGSKGGWWALD
jgi:hypothetical protein